MLMKRKAYYCVFFVIVGVKDVDAKWIGWAGVNVPDEVGQRALTKALAEKVLFILRVFPESYSCSTF